MNSEGTRGADTGTPLWVKVSWIIALVVVVMLVVVLLVRGTGGGNGPTRQALSGGVVGHTSLEAFR